MQYDCASDFDHASHRINNLTTSSHDDEPDDTILIAQMFDKYSHARTFATPKIVVDIYAGDLSLAKYYLKRYTDCIAICYDMKKEEEAMKTVPKYMRSRIYYVEQNVCHITIQDIEREIRRLMPDASMHDVYHIHASPDCTTMSTAECRHDKHAYIDYPMVRPIQMPQHIVAKE